MQETVDVLNRGQFIDMLYQLVNTMSDLKQGKIFSIDGTWGYGKTYVLEELERRLSPVVNEETYDDKFYVFHYNCWQYDYYEEPSVAIISAMLETSENSLEHRINKVAKAGWETAKEILTDVAGQYVKNKIGVDIVETFQSEKMGIDNQKFKFDQMFAFKKTLDETREKLKRMSEIKTVVIVVDELDRCMPEYAVKVLERLHHLFEGIPNTIVKDIIEYLKKKKNIAMTHTRIIGMNSEEIMVSNDFNGEAWHILDQLLAHKKTLYMDPVNQTVDIDECKKFIEFAKILW